MLFKLPLSIASKYFFTKKSKRAIHIISLITTIAIAIGTFALIVVLSVFNGFEGLVISMFNQFDPDIKVTSKIGKTFNYDKSKIASINGIEAIGKSVEENVLLKYKQQQYIATIKGIDENIFERSGIKNGITTGYKNLLIDGVSFAVLGAGVADKLSLNTESANEPLSIYYPNKDVTNININPANAFKIEGINIGGIFSIQQEFDVKYVIVPLQFAQRFFETNNQISSLEIYVNSNTNVDEVCAEISNKLGSNYEVKNRFQQHNFIYKVMKAEKWAVFFILLFILIIATFNLTGALTMLIIDKQHDIFIMKSFGANTKLIKQIFVFNGLIITASGIVIGTVLGLAVCFAQQQFGLLQFNGEGSFVVDAYPVKIIFVDVLYVAISVFVIGFIASIIPVQNIFRNNNFNTKN